MLLRIVNHSFLLTAIGIGGHFLFHPPTASSSFVHAKDDTENIHNGLPHLAAGDFGQGLRKKRNVGGRRRPNKKKPRKKKKNNKEKKKNKSKEENKDKPRKKNKDKKKDKKKKPKEENKDKKKDKQENIQNKDNDKGGDSSSSKDSSLAGSFANNGKDKGNQSTAGSNKPSKPKQPSQPSAGSSNNKPSKPKQPSESSPASQVLHILSSKSTTIDTKLFLYETPGGGWEPSTIYNQDGLSKGLQIMNSRGVAGMHYYLGDKGSSSSNSNDEYKYGLTNVAAFLAQSMKETIKYNACSENNWDLIQGVYAISNACGQLGQSYQDYKCPKGEEHMVCEIDLEMESRAVTNAKWYGAPPPFFCEPKKNKDDFTGKWNHGFMCNVGWLDPPLKCEEYEGQKAGGYVNDKPVANRAGRTDVEGCCWWGRGVIQTTGPCNFGKLNYYLGARAAKDGRDSAYPSIDFCKDPEIICSSSKYVELKWIAGMFYWMESVQQYNEGGWNYMEELRKFVDGGLKDRGFIDAVSGIVNRGCHNPPCGTGAVDGGTERNANFIKTLRAFELIDSPEGFDKDVKVGGGSTTSTACGADHAKASASCKNIGCHSQLDCDAGEYCWNGVEC